MGEALADQANKAKPAQTVVAKNTYNAARPAPARTNAAPEPAPAVNALAEEKQGTVYIDGKVASPRQAKFVATYRDSLALGYSEEESYARALVEWNQDTRLLPPAPAPEQRRDTVRIQGDPKVTELFNQFRAMPVEELQRIVGVEVPRMPSQFQIDDDAYTNFLAYSAAHNLGAAVSRQLLEFAADEHVANVGGEFNVAEAEQRFKEKFGGRLSADQMSLLIDFYKTEVLGTVQPSDQGQQREGDVLLSDADDADLEGMTDEQIDAALLYELDLSAQQESLRQRGLGDQLWESWTPRQRRTLEKLGITRA
jgi:hypothetical protein